MVVKDNQVALWRFPWFYRVLFFFFLGATTIACLLPGTTVASLVPVNDKLVHGAAWFAVALTATSAFALRHHARRWAVALLFWSFLIEVLQQFVPNRAFEWADLLANGTGIVAGILLARAVRHLPLISSRS